MTPPVNKNDKVLPIISASVKSYSCCLHQKPQLQSSNRTALRESVVFMALKAKIDSVQGRHVYSQRLGTVESVFGNINTTKRLNRFNLIGKTKVNAQ